MNRFLGLLLLFGAMAHVQAADAPSAEILAGCAACHGANGGGNQALGAPPLAGQDAAYLARQLHNFKNDRRGYAEQDAGGRQMRAFATGLSDEGITRLSAYFATLPAVRLADSPMAANSDGAARYQTTCAYCHGLKAQGYPQMQAPNLRLLGGWYIDKQMANFVSGARGAEGHADIQGLWMRSIATHITPQEQQAVVSFIESLGR